jgi:hypothetical protein
MKDAFFSEGLEASIGAEESFMKVKEEMHSFFWAK